MGKIYTAMGLMSGTSSDGIDVSIIESDGNEEYSSILDRYFEYDSELIRKLLKIRSKISNINALNTHIDEIKALEREITLLHVKAVNDTLKISKSPVDLIGFHGQTIFHNPEERISVQLGDGKLLSQLSKKTVIYNFRKNDLMNGGQGAPLTPIFHKSLKEKIYGNNIPVIFINIGGITNVTCFNSMDKIDKSMFASDIGPGNCLIDEWVRNNTNEKYDKDGIIAKSGKINELILNQALDNFEGNLNSSLDIKDFDVSFARGLSLEDGASTITNFTAEIITTSLKNLLDKNKYDLDNHLLPNFIVCGGGRKNKYLMDILSVKISKKIGYKKFQLIDEHNIDGDFIESEAFAFLAIRSFLNLPISFPNTTGCKEPCTGGVMVTNY